MIFITDELGKFEKNIIELAENMGSVSYTHLDVYKRQEKQSSNLVQ